MLSGEAALLLESTVRVNNTEHMVLLCLDSAIRQLCHGTVECLACTLSTPTHWLGLHVFDLSTDIVCRRCSICMHTNLAELGHLLTNVQRCAVCVCVSAGGCRCSLEAL